MLHFRTRPIPGHPSRKSACIPARSLAAGVLTATLGLGFGLLTAPGAHAQVPLAPQPAPAPGPDPSKVKDVLIDPATFKTAEELWSYIQELPAKTGSSGIPRAELYTIANNALVELINRFPESPKVWDAKLLLVQVEVMQGTQPMEGATQYEAIAADLKAPEKVKLEAHRRAVVMLMLAAVKDEKALELVDRKIGGLESYRPAPPKGYIASVRKEQLNMLSRIDMAKAFELAKRLSASTDEDVKALGTAFMARAEKMMAAEKEMADLKSKPFELKFTAIDGTEVDMEKLRGKVVLLDFWATWCGPCVEEVPTVVAAYKKLKDKGFEIIGISLDKNKKDVLSFIKENNMTWPQHCDEKGWKNEISTKYGISSIPAMWLINKKGLIVSTNARKDLEKQVEALLAE